MNRSVSYFRGRLRTLVLALMGVGVLALLPLRVGIRAVDWHHARARVRISGMHSETEIARAREYLQRVAGYRRSRLALVALNTPDTWRAEIEFEASSLTEATLRLQEWRNQFPVTGPVSVEQLTFQPLRLYRPGRGDVVLGPPQVLSGPELEATVDLPAGGRGRSGHLP